MIRDYIHPEDFLMDDTFLKYCEGSDLKCIKFWEQWINKNPEKEDLILRAKQLHHVVSGGLLPLHEQVETIKSKLNKNDHKLIRFNFLRLLVAACFFVLILGPLFYFLLSKKAEDANITYVKAFDTTKGRRKKIVLTDGTTILINAGSKIELAEGYGKNNRDVRLSGEAFFDVTHNKNLPFKVLTKNFKVTVLGTVFNVKAYPEEKFAEAALVKGLIKIEDNSHKGGIVTLKSGQKITYYVHAQTATKNHKNELLQLPQLEIGQLTTFKKEIVETAWTQNNLIFNNLKFIEIKPLLERWYNVSIEFKDSDIANYRFTATFTKENIIEVLKTLQKVKYFNYQMKGEKIIVRK